MMLTRQWAGWRLMPDGTRRRLKPGGRLLFGYATLLWLRRRAKRLGHTVVFKRIRTKRDKMILAMRWGLNNEPSIHYLQRRPFRPRMILDRKLPMWDDCSATTTQLARAGGFPDPNRRGFDGTGYTGTLRRSDNKIPLADVKPGDYIIYGPGTGYHVAVVYKTDIAGDPLMWSHGQESGPRLYRHSVERAAISSTYTCHSVAA